MLPAQNVILPKPECSFILQYANIFIFLILLCIEQSVLPLSDVFKVAKRVGSDYKLRVGSAETLFSSPGEYFMTIGGLNLNFYRHGTGPHPVLCLPGILGSWRTDFARQLFGPTALDPKKFSVICWDPPGFGRSRPPNRDFSRGFIRREAELAHSLMKKLSFEQYSVIGWSSGCHTAALLPHRLGIITKVVLVSGYVFVNEKDINLHKELRNTNIWHKKELKQYLNTHDLNGGGYFRKTWWAWVDALVRFYNENGGNICSEFLSDIIAPTLIISGGKDNIVGQEHSIYLQENLPNSKMLRLPEGRHDLHMRHPTWFKKHVEEFLLSQTLNTFHPE